MDNSLGHHDHGLDTPQVRHVGASRPWHWLKLGWQDLAANPAASLAYGAFFALVGYLILAFASARPYLFTAAISGFLLIGPIAAAGLYEMSRRRAAGERSGFFESLKGLKREGDQLAYFGLGLAITLILWERLSAILFALFYAGVAPDLSNLFNDIAFSGNYLNFVAAYLVVGGALAALVFAFSAIAIPMILDRSTDVVTAMITSARAVGHNLVPMILWAAMIVIAMAIGFATMMVGMVLLLPVVGHATWHAYKDLVE